MSESGSGEPVDSNAANDKDSSVCPGCGSTYSTYHGMRTHYFQYCEGDSTGECDWCGDEITDRPPAELENSKRLFCDRECNGKWRSENFIGEDAPNYRGNNKVDCSYCGEELHRDPNQIERAENCFCGDKRCKAKYQSEQVGGENHPRWSGGYDGYYGSNWERKRREALQRDEHTCQYCGDGREDTEAVIQVHHIRPINDFEVKEDANSLSNLVTLCEPCHGTWEGLYLRPDTR